MNAALAPVAASEESLPGVGGSMRPTPKAATRERGGAREPPHARGADHAARGRICGGQSWELGRARRRDIPSPARRRLSPHRGRRVGDAACALQTLEGPGRMRACVGQGAHLGGHAELHRLVRSGSSVERREPSAAQDCTGRTKAEDHRGPGTARPTSCETPSCASSHRPSTALAMMLRWISLEPA